MSCYAVQESRRSFWDLHSRALWNCCHTMYVSLKSAQGIGPLIRLKQLTTEPLPPLAAELRTTFLEPQNGFFWVGCVYGRNDDAARFAWFCGAAAEFLRTSEHR
jgi:hypothetical protein